MQLRKFISGVVVHHAGFSGDDAQEKAEKKADVLRSKGLDVVVEKVPPLRPSLPYQGIAHRALKFSQGVH